MLPSPSSPFWAALSGLGGANLTGALALALAALLMADGEGRLARWWCCLFLAGMAGVAMSKLACIGWGIDAGPLDFTGASGHAARATAVYPVLCYTLVRHRGHGVQQMALGAAIVLAAGIACARLAHHVHSPVEVATGMLAGAIVAATYLRLARAGGNGGAVRLAPWLAPVALYAASLPAAPTQAWLVHAGLALAGRPAQPAAHDAAQRPRAGLAVPARLAGAGPPRRPVRLNPG
jgi:membrane-associated phospholipid phosphatase